MDIITVIRNKWLLVVKRPQLLLIKPLYVFSPLLSDKLYLRWLFRLKTGYKLNLENPQTYNEKLQWLKLFYRDSLLPKLVDKYEYKEHVKQVVGEEYIVKNYGVWESFDDINFDELPDQFVLKTTHDQGGVVICKDKSNFDLEEARKKITKHLKRNLFYLLREWPYKQVTPRVLAEELLVDATTGDLYDYKFYCFHGEPQFMYIAHGRHTERNYLDFFDMDFNHLNIGRKGYFQSNKIFDKPRNWGLMIDFARKISAGQPHVRIDFFNINGKIYFGEYTLFQGGGMMPFYPQSWDFEFGKHLELPVKQL